MRSNGSRLVYTVTREDPNLCSSIHAGVPVCKLRHSGLYLSRAISTEEVVKINTWTLRLIVRTVMFCHVFSYDFMPTPRGIRELWLRNADRVNHDCRLPDDFAVVRDYSVLDFCLILDAILGDQFSEVAAHLVLDVYVEYSKSWIYFDCLGKKLPTLPTDLEIMLTVQFVNMHETQPDAAMLFVQA